MSEPHTTQSLWTILKIGGSILVPDGPDGEYCAQLRDLLHERVAMGEKFLVIVGGGAVARQYQGALGVAGIKESDMHDYIGIHTITLNAQFMRFVFGETAHPAVVYPQDELVTEASIVVCGAKDPGHSSNYDAVLFAEKVGAQRIINVSNVDYVYSDDPRKNPDAIKFERVGWGEYRTFIPSEWEPGMPTPFDPIASRRAQELGLEVVFMKGRPIENLRKYLESGEVEGSIISGK